MALNLTEITFNGCRTAKGEPLFQFDYGQIVKFVDLDLPDAYEVHFASISDAETVTVIGSADGVAIPDQYLQTAGTINMYIFLHESEDDGDTEYRASITVLPRPEPSDLEPTPVQQDAITQAIAALNTAVTESSQSASDAAEAAEAAVQSAQDAAESAASIDTSSFATKSELQDEASARSSADTSLGNTIGAEVQRATQEEASIRSAIPSKTSDLVNDSHYITAAEAPVQSVNGQSGNVTISMPSIDSVVTPGGTNPVNSVAIIAYINSLDADDTEY